LEKHYSLDFLKDYYGDDMEAMTHVLRLYIEETPKELERIENCLKNNDAAGAKAVVHKMKTNVAMLGIVDHDHFINAIHLQSPEGDVAEEIHILFRGFKSEVMLALKNIENDFLVKK
jgi:hypothetical protein